MLGSSRTECDVSEGISPSTSLVNLRPSERLYHSKNFTKSEKRIVRMVLSPPGRK